MSLDLYFTSLYFYEYEIPEIFEIASKLGFKGIELNLELYHIWFAKDISKVMKNIADLEESYNLPLTLHAPFIDINLMSYNHKLRSLSEREIQKSIFWANKLGIPIVTVHMGAFPFGFEYKSEDYFIRKFYKYGVSALKNLYEFADDLNIRVGVENLHYVQGKFPKTPEHFDILLRDIPELKITFDLAHAYTISETIAWDILKQYSKNIINIHVSDVDKTTKKHHIGITDGFVDFYHFFKLLKKHNIKAPIVIELSATATCRNKFSDKKFRADTLNKSKEKLEEIYRNVSKGL